MISVIIPVYNMEKYLNQCLESIVNQDYHDIEILLVDDGSKDGSLNLCNKWASKDSRIRVFTKENGGQGSARNLALKEIRGEYVSFIDSDDLVTKDMYTSLIEVIEKNQADMVICETKTFSDGESVILEENKQSIQVVMNTFEAMQYRMNSVRYVTDSPCNKLYKAKLFDSLFFVEGRLLEDTAMMYKLIDRCQKVVYTNKIGYLIRNNMSSVSRVKYNVKRCDTIITYEEMVDFISSKSEYKSLIAKCIVLANGAIFYNAGEFVLSKIKNKEIKKFIKEHAKKQLKEYKPLTKKNKLLLRIIVNTFWLYGLMYKINKKR